MKFPATKRNGKASGYTLIEMVMAISIMGIIGLVSSYTIMESMKVYSRVVPQMDTSY